MLVDTYYTSREMEETEWEEGTFFPEAIVFLGTFQEYLRPTKTCRSGSSRKPESEPPPDRSLSLLQAFNNQA